MVLECLGVFCLVFDGFGVVSGRQWKVVGGTRLLGLSIVIHFTILEPNWARHPPNIEENQNV